ncbi:hypothetical protein RN001_002977 [Aquatica leii]|uniref:Uncharacterized protein n=1 Tax=Aquatica leii TaxID=1421715 RepID=A0AAN7PN23_9COLE|nr:hypothetical protein RN001_002977 [Aquatica leii]
MSGHLQILGHGLSTQCTTLEAARKKSQDEDNKGVGCETLFDLKNTKIMMRKVLVLISLKLAKTDKFVTTSHFKQS